MKLGLGTVQLGLNYGIANKTGKPDNGGEIIKAAIDNGINSFDTAASYGDSEEILGKAIRRWSLAGEIQICSKFTSADNMENQLEQSLRRLGVESLDFYLLHGAAEVFEKGEAMNLAFKEIKSRGLVKKCGVSVYNEGEIAECLKHDEIEILQVPFNILDVRLARVLRRLKERGVELHVRSVYLQGLLLMERGKIPDKLGGVIPFLEKLDKLAESLNLSRQELAFLYARDFSGADKIFVGCETKTQLLENIEINKLESAENISEQVENLFAEVPVQILNPSLW